jgi:putative transposase
MKKTRYSEEQIIGILKEAEAGIPITELCRKYGISDATYYNWKARYGGMTTSEMRRLRQLEDENRRLKQLVADLILDNQALKAVISKNG